MVWRFSPKIHKIKHFSPQPWSHWQNKTFFTTESCVHLMKPLYCETCHVFLIRVMTARCCCLRDFIMHWRVYFFKPLSVTFQMVLFISFIWTVNKLIAGENYGQNENYEIGLVIGYFFSKCFYQTSVIMR